MSNYFLDLIKKSNKHSETHTQKYDVINCQNMVDKNIDTRDYIKLNDIMKDNKDLKIFDAVFGKSSVIIKIGKSETIIKEYNISHLLYDQFCYLILNQKYKYLVNKKLFIKYICYFSCKNNIKDIVSNSSVCKSDGDQLSILIMKKYNFGNVKNYIWTKENFNILKEIIKQIFFGLYMSYDNFGFIHNDVHFGNFLIRDNYDVIIIDFENGIFDKSKQNIYFLYVQYQQILSNIYFELHIKTNVYSETTYFDKYIETKTLIDINQLLDYIDNIIFISKNDTHKKLVYDPNIF